MAFLLEDGTGLSNSNSYASATEMKAYFADRGTNLSSVLDATLQPFLIQATDYIDQRFAFQGTIYVDTQALQWPRSDVYDSLNDAVTGVPTKVKYATCEYANILRLGGTLWTTPTVDTGGVLTGKTTTVGPITTSVQYSQPAPVERSFPAADKYLKSFLAGSGGNFR